MASGDNGSGDSGGGAPIPDATAPTASTDEAVGSAAAIDDAVGAMATSDDAAQLPDPAAVGETIDRRVSPDGVEIALVRRGEVFEIISDGQFLMASDCRRSERSLAELTLAPLSQRADISVLVGGLGMGFTLRAALDSPTVVRVDVVEVSEAVIEWNRTYFGALHGGALDDPRVRIHQGDLLGFLKRHRYAQIEEESGLPSVKDGWMALMLDVDNGPQWLSRPGNEVIYGEDGIARLEHALRPGGVLGVWSAERDVEFVRRLHAQLIQVAEMAVPVEVRGHASLDYIYRGRRPADKPAGSGRIAQA